MINRSILKIINIQTALFACILLVTSCDSNQNTRDSNAAAENQNDTRNNDNDNDREKDAQFLVKAAEINLEEIQLGQLAQQKGRATHIKELGKMMEDAHTKSQRDLTALAQSKGVSIPNSPTEDARDAYQNLNEKSGDDFDATYANIMVSTHRDALSSFEKAAEDSNDTDIRNWARTSVPGLRTHLNHSIESQKKFADMYLEKN